MIGRNPKNMLLWSFLFIVIGAAMTSVKTAAVVGNDKQQQLLQANVDADVSVAEQQGSCDDGRVMNCRTLPIFNYTELSPPPGAGGAADINLDENCPSKSLEKHLRCVDMFTKRCMTISQRRTFYKLYTMPTLDMQELCTEGGPYREEYLKHAACLRTVHSEYVKCGNRHQSELAALMTDHNQHQSNGGEATTAMPLGDAEQITQNLAHLCGSFRGHLKCVHGIVRTTCGPETEAFASQFLSQMASSLLNICDKYANVSGVSNGGSGGNESPSSSGSTKTTGTATLTVILMLASWLR